MCFHHPTPLVHTAAYLSKDISANDVIKLIALIYRLTGSLAKRLERGGEILNIIMFASAARVVFS